MFFFLQLTAELPSESGECIKSLSRPCMLRFHSEPIRWLKTLLLGLPSLVGIGSESQTHTIKLTEFGHQHIPIAAVKILLQSKAGMPLGHGIPEIYFANVHIESKLPWLKNLVRSWKWTFYIWMGLMLYIIDSYNMFVLLSKILKVTSFELNESTCVSLSTFLIFTSVEANF